MIQASTPHLSFFQEAKERWHLPSPPFFIKAGNFGIALTGFGTTIAGISIGCKWLIWITAFAGALAGIGAGITALSKFVVQSGILLPPGGSVTNATPETVQLNVTDQSS